MRTTSEAGTQLQRKGNGCLLGICGRAPLQPQALLLILESWILTSPQLPLSLTSLFSLPFLGYLGSGAECLAEAGRTPEKLGRYRMKATGTGGKNLFCLPQSSHFDPHIAAI